MGAADGVDKFGRPVLVVADEASLLAVAPLLFSEVSKLYPHAEILVAAQRTTTPDSIQRGGRPGRLVILAPESARLAYLAEVAAEKEANTRERRKYLIRRAGSEAVERSLRLQPALGRKSGLQPARDQTGSGKPQ